MTTNTGCIAVLLDTMGIVTGAAADESNASSTEKRSLSPIILDARQQGVPVYDIRRPEEWRQTGALARHLVEQMGYTHAYNVRHGITGWIGDKHLVVRNN